MSRVGSSLSHPSNQSKGCSSSVISSSRATQIDQEERSLTKIVSNEVDETGCSIPSHFQGRFDPPPPTGLHVSPSFEIDPRCVLPPPGGKKTPPCGVRDEGGDSIDIILPPSMERSSISPLRSRRGARRFPGPTSDPLYKLIPISLIGERSSGSRSPVGFP